MKTYMKKDYCRKRVLNHLEPFWINEDVPYSTAFAYSNNCEPRSALASNCFYHVISQRVLEVTKLKMPWCERMRPANRKYMYGVQLN